MKARMEMRVDTTWGNQIILSTEAELDNPSLLNTRELSALMIHSLAVMLNEVRLEDDRHARALQDDPPPLHEASTPSERERSRFETMERERRAERAERGTE